jgi:WD40 repeat protein
MREYRFWSVGTWKPGPVIPRDNPGYFTGPLAFTHDGKMLVIAHSSRLARLIEPATGTELATLEGPDPEQLNGFSFSPDGRWLAASATNRRVYLWDLRLIRQQLRAMGLDWEEAGY